MVKLELARGERKRYWFLELSDPVTREAVQLPETDDWREAVHVHGALAEIYGPQNVKLYQRDVTWVLREAEDSILVDKQ